MFASASVIESRSAGAENLAAFLAAKHERLAAGLSVRGVSWSPDNGWTDGRGGETRATSSAAELRSESEDPRDVEANNFLRAARGATAQGNAKLTRWFLQAAERTLRS
jgi:hypothetical protein